MFISGLHESTQVEQITWRRSCCEDNACLWCSLCKYHFSCKKPCEQTKGNFFQLLLFSGNCSYSFFLKSFVLYRMYMFLYQFHHQFHVVHRIKRKKLLVLKADHYQSGLFWCLNLAFLFSPRNTKNSWHVLKYLKNCVQSFMFSGLICVWACGHYFIWRNR